MHACVPARPSIRKPSPQACRRASALLEASDCPPAAWQPLVVARCLQLQGSLAAAGVFFRKAIDAHPALGAGQWLPPGAVVTSHRGQATMELTDPVVWATGKATYQTLGLLMGVLGEPDSQQLMNLLDNDARLRAVVTLGRAAKASADTALGLLNQVPTAQQTIGDRLLIAELLARQGQLADATGHWQTAIDGNPSELQLRRIAQAALHYGQPTMAGRAIEPLLPLAGTDVEVFALQLRWMGVRTESSQ